MENKKTYSRNCILKHYDLNKFYHAIVVGGCAFSYGCWCSISWYQFRPSV